MALAPKLEEQRWNAIRPAGFRRGNGLLHTGPARVYHAFSEFESIADGWIKVYDATSVTGLPRLMFHGTQSPAATVSLAMGNGYVQFDNGIFVDDLESAVLHMAWESSLASPGWETRWGYPTRMRTARRNSSGQLFAGSVRIYWAVFDTETAASFASLHNSIGASLGQLALHGDSWETAVTEFGGDYVDFDNGVYCDLSAGLNTVTVGYSHNAAGPTEN